MAHFVSKLLFLCSKEPWFVGVNSYQNLQSKKIHTKWIELAKENLQKNTMNIVDNHGLLSI